MSALPLLHWPLDSYSRDGLVFDKGERHLNGAVKGEPATVPDSRFGSCLRFDGSDDMVALSPAPALTSYTLSAWVNPTLAQRTGPLVLLGKGFQLILMPNGSISHRMPTTTSATDGHTTPVGLVPAGSWTHVAATADGRNGKIYINGVLKSEYASSGVRITDSLPFYAGAKSLVSLAHVRLYEGAQTALEIKRDLAADQSALERFVRSHPLDFSLTNRDAQPVLYIDEAPGGQPLTVQLTNTSRQDLEILPLTGALSVDSYHFALRFRRGTLPAGMKAVPAGADWAVLTEADGTAVYLQWKAPKPILPGASTTLTLNGFTADGTGGTRGTRVELDYRRLRYRGEADELSGTRLQFLDVVNHRGRRDAPVDARIVGGDRVLSDGKTPCSLRIHLTNPLRDGPGILLRAGTPAVPASAFVVSFDVQQVAETRPWALTSAGDAGVVTLASDVPGWMIQPGMLGQRMTWTVSPTADTTLKPDGFLDLTLRNIIALASPGHSPIVIGYRNIPGYADGSLTVRAERAPMIFTAAGNTGVGTNAPAAKLHVFSDAQSLTTGLLALGPVKAPLQVGLAAGLGWIGMPAGQNLALLPATGNVSIGSATPQAKLHVTFAPTTADLQPALIIGGTNATDSQWRLGYAADHLWVQSAGSRPIAIQPLAGSVGIGTTKSAEARLTVSAPQTHLQLRREASAGPGGKTVFLELYQDTTTGTDVTYPSIRFHHAYKFWHRIEGRPEGIHFRNGNLTEDSLVDISAKIATLTGLRIGGVTIGEAELLILQKLAAGTLQFDLYNVKQGEYAYAADYNPYDADRRYVWTWRPKSRINQGRWALHFPA